MADLDSIYRQHAETVYRFLYAKTASAELAEELTQETFFQAVSSIQHYDESCQISTWLCAIARNVLMAYNRKQRRAPLSLDDIPEPTSGSAEETVLMGVDVDRLRAYVRSLPEPIRELVRLRLLGGLSFRQIGAALGQTENWARVNYYRAKQKIVKELTENE